MNTLGYISTEKLSSSLVDVGSDAGVLLVRD